MFYKLTMDKSKMQYPKPTRYIDKTQKIPVYICPDCPGGEEYEGKQRYIIHRQGNHSDSLSAPVPQPDDEELVVAPVVEEEEIVVAEVIEE